MFGDLYGFVFSVVFDDDGEFFVIGMGNEDVFVDIGFDDVIDGSKDFVVDGVIEIVVDFFEMVDIVEY